MKFVKYEQAHLKPLQYRWAIKKTLTFQDLHPNIIFIPPFGKVSDGGNEYIPPCIQFHGTELDYEPEDYVYGDVILDPETIEYDPTA